MKFSIKNLFKKGEKKKKLKGPFKKTSHPRRDWATLLIFFALLLVAVSFGSYVIYNQFINQDILLFETGESGVIDEEKLDRVIGVFEERENLSEFYITNPKTIVDPSL